MVKPHRITAGTDYRNTVRRGRRVGGKITIAHAVFVSEEHPARFGYIISKAVGNAVVRNRIRRRMKAISDDIVREGFTGADVVFRALPAAQTASFHDLKHEMHHQVARIWHGK